MKERLSEIYSGILGNKGSKLHRQSTGGCVHLAPSSGHHTPSSPSDSSSLNSGLARLSTLMVGAQQVGENARLSRIG
jgi:hypothetical protein